MRDKEYKEKIGGRKIAQTSKNVRLPYIFPSPIFLCIPYFSLRVGRISQQVDELTSKFVKFLVSYHSYL